MSTTTSPSPLTSPTPSGSHNVGLGYGIAIAISILVLISTVMLASYACIRIKAGGRSGHFDEDDNDDSNNGGGGVHNRPNTIQRPVVNGLLPGPMLVKVCWVQPKKGESYPQVVLGESKKLPKPNNGPCSICLSEYKPKETVRCMPDCNHCFHVPCIDQWLKMSPTCPLCRNSPAPKPSGTPLSELVPLAFYPI